MSRSKPIKDLYPCLRAITDKEFVRYVCVLTKKQYARVKARAKQIDYSVHSLHLAEARVGNKDSDNAEWFPVKIDREDIDSSSMGFLKLADAEITRLYDVPIFGRDVLVEFVSDKKGKK